MKILSIMNYKVKGSGITQQMLRLFSDLKNEGINTFICSTYGNVFQRLFNIIKIFRNAQNYDLVFASGCAYTGFLPIIVGTYVAKWYNKPLIIDFHDGQAKVFMHKWGKYAQHIMRYGTVTVATQFLYDIFKNYKLKVVLIPHHFDFTQIIHNKNNKYQWNKKFIWTRAFYPLYDPETALKAAKLVLEIYPDMEFHFFGDGPLRKKLEKKYKMAGIIFRGHIVHNDLLKEYGEFSVFINTSLYDNFPISIVEAAANNLLVITTPVGGIRTLYSEDECLFFRPRNYKELAHHILKVIENPYKFVKFVNNLKNKVLKFTWSNVKDKWLNLLIQLMREKAEG